MNRVAYIAVADDGTIVGTGETDEAAFLVLAPKDLVRIPLGTPVQLGWHYASDTKTVSPSEEVNHAE